MRLTGELYAQAGALHRADRLDEAEKLYRQVLDLDPRHADAIGRLGVLEHQRGRPAQAVDLMRSAIALKGGSVPSFYNLALALYDLDRLEEAVAACREALRLRPGFEPADYTLALSLKDLGRIDEALAHYRKVQTAEARYGEAFALLLKGDLAAGWPGYEARRQIFPQRIVYPGPQWRGEPIAGRTLLVHAEQGLGDTIQFSRYVPLAAATGARVILEAQPALLPLLSRLPGVDRLIGFGDRVPPYDFHCPMLSLPGVFGTTLETIPPATLGRPARPPRRIGVAWRGNPTHSEDRRRSLSAEQMARCFAGIEPVCLQKDATSAELSSFERIDASSKLADFGETASVIAGLDLVVTVDTAVAHLAGSLGMPCWVLIGFAPDWRWMLGREDSPWYPSLRLFRQKQAGDWNTVLDRIRILLMPPGGGS